MPTETWKLIPVATDYEISDSGNIRKITPPKRRRRYNNPTPYKRPCGYLYVSLRVNGKATTFQHHRLMAMAFFGPSSLSVNHKNGNPSDNRLENLEYVTHAENSRHAYWVLNRGPHGDKHHNAKLRAIDIPEIWRLHDLGLSTFKIAARFNCTPENIQTILKGKGWIRVSAQLGRLPAPT